MKILDIKLHDFRNYDTLELKFNPSKNIIIGKNGEGKTNIVEAIYVLALTKSFRGSKEDVIIKYDKESTRVEGKVKDKNSKKYRVILNREGKKTVRIDNTNINRITDYLSNINIVLFTIDDLKLIKDTPSTRRKLIDIELSQFSNEYLKLLTLYNKVLKQRNSYLKMMYLNGNSSKDYLSILTNQLIELGMKIFKYRCEFIEDLNNFIETNYFKITGNHDLKIVYKSSFTNKDKLDLEKLYKRELDRDITQGKTNSGIHHDDYEFYLNDRNLKDYGSEGEQKNAIIALKMAEIDIFKDRKGVTPILILDDLFSELDKQKINNILKFISDDIQTFVTTTEINKVSNRLKLGSTIFEVKNGMVKERQA